MIKTLRLNRWEFPGAELETGETAEEAASSDCYLSESNFDGCNLTDTEFFRCDISKAGFRNATGYKVDIMSCIIKKARFSAPEAYNLLDSLDIKID